MFSLRILSIIFCLLTTLLFVLLLSFLPSNFLPKIIPIGIHNAIHTSAVINIILLLLVPLSYHKPLFYFNPITYKKKYKYNFLYF